MTISMARGMDATTSTTVKERASTTEVMCARCKYTTEQRVRLASSEDSLFGLRLPTSGSGGMSIGEGSH